MELFECGLNLGVEILKEVSDANKEQAYIAYTMLQEAAEAQDAVKFLHYIEYLASLAKQDLIVRNRQEG